MTSPARTALVLAGHGSHISPHTAGIIWRYVDSLRAAGAADEITAAFWKEMPSFHTVLRTLTADDITIVPVFTANGYFTQTVIPAEMSLTGAVTETGGKIIRYTPPVGIHPRIREIMRGRVRSALENSGTAPADAAVAVIGHSTRRNPESRLATLAQAEYLRAAYPDVQVEAVFLDDDPEIPLIYDLTDRALLIAVPYFLAAGSHTTIDVPAELGLARGQTSGQIRGRSVYYTPPVGTGDELCQVILDMAREAGAPLNAARSGTTWACFPQAGRDDFVRAVQECGELYFGQLCITPSEVRPVDNGQTGSTAITDAASLRAIAREDPFRPLAYPVKPGWHVPAASPEMLHAAVETIYPGAVAAWAAAQHNTMSPVTLAQTLKRQTGMYRALSALDNAAQTRLTAEICAACARVPCWSEAFPAHEHIPCIEPCNVWLSAALETLKHD